MAMYTYNVVTNMPGGVDWGIIAREDWPRLVELSKEYDIVHIMHHGGLMTWLTPEQVRACGKTVISRQCIGSEDVFSAATIKTAHMELDGYRFIPHGIPVIQMKRYGNPQPELSVGCAGIPFSGKGHFEAVAVAKELDCKVRLVIPDTHHTAPVAEDYRGICDDTGIPCEILTGWPTEEEVIRFLSRSTANVFFYTRPANGVSGAVRLGLAARRPVIVSDHSQFQDIIAKRAVNVADDIDDAVRLVMEYRAGQQLIVPANLVDEWGYDKTALMYYDIYGELMA